MEGKACQPGVAYLGSAAYPAPPPRPSRLIPSMPSMATVRPMELLCAVGWGRRLEATPTIIACATPSLLHAYRVNACLTPVKMKRFNDCLSCQRGGSLSEGGAMVGHSGNIAYANERMARLLVGRRVQFRSVCSLAGPDTTHTHTFSRWKQAAGASDTGQQMQLSWLQHEAITEGILNGMRCVAAAQL